MPRATNAPASRLRRKRVLNQAKGYYGNKSRLYRYAKDAVEHALQHAYKDRRHKKSTWRALWITRINAACRAQGMSYSRFIEGINAAGILLDRKAMADFAARDEAAFTKLVEQARAALKAKAGAAS
jgi:large subunit ribosomal protein L20